MAMVVARTGAVFRQLFDRTGSIQLRLGFWNEMKVDFRPAGSATCGVYHLDWTTMKFGTVKFQHVAPKY